MEIQGQTKSLAGLGSGHRHRVDTQLGDERRRIDSDETQVIAYVRSQPKRISKNAPVTVTAKDFESQATAELGSSGEVLGVDSRSDVERTSEGRLTLLQRELDGHATIEDNARYLILTQRLRRIAPPVVASQWNALESLTSQLESIAQAIDSVAGPDV
jgi:hypothetical protein